MIYGQRSGTIETEKLRTAGVTAKECRSKWRKVRMGKIIAVNVSEKKGTQKKNVHSAKLIEDWGIENDAHAGKWHRQVSLLSYERERRWTRALSGRI